MGEIILNIKFGADVYRTNRLNDLTNGSKKFLKLVYLENKNYYGIYVCNLQNIELLASPREREGELTRSRGHIKPHFEDIGEDQTKAFIKIRKRRRYQDRVDNHND